MKQRPEPAMSQRRRRGFLPPPPAEVGPARSLEDIVHLMFLLNTEEYIRQRSCTECSAAVHAETAGVVAGEVVSAVAA